MPGTIVNNMTALQEADATTGWTGLTTPSLYTAFFRESTGCLGVKLNAAAGWAYAAPAGSPLNMANMTIHGWNLFYVGRDTYANGGMSLIVGDGTNRAGFPCAGSDVAGYHATPDGWSCVILSVPDKVDGEAITLAGTAASINDAAVTQIGYYFAASTSAVGNVDNTFWDIVWAYTHTGYAVEITAGTDVSPAGFTDLSDYDSSTATLRGLGVMSEVAAGVFSNTAPVQVGDDGTGTSYFVATNEEIIFEDVGHLNNHKFTVVGNATGTNTAYFTSFTFRNVHSTLTPTLNFNGGNIDVLEFDGCAIIGCAVNFSSTTDATGHKYVNGTFTNCGAIDMGSIADATANLFTSCGAVTSQGCDMTDSSILTSTVAANASALIYNETADPDGEFDGMTFSKGTNAHHAIEFGLSSPLTMTLRNVTCTGFNAADTQNDSTFHFKRTTGTVTLNLVGFTGNYTYRTDGATIILVVDPVTVKATATLKDGTPVASARVYLRASDGTGPFPFEETVTSITRATTTATVTHASHGMATGDKIVLEGITDKTEDNYLVKTITVTGVNTYTYTTTDSGSTAYTGTIKSTFVALFDTTDVNGEASVSRVYSSAQPVTGWTRKSSATPFLQEGVLNGTVSSTLGFNGTAVMLGDE